MRRVAAGTPLLEVARERVEPDLLPHEEGSVRIGQKTGAAQEVEHRRVRLPGAAFFIKPATTTSPTQREPNRSLAFLCIVSLPRYHFCERAVEPLGAGPPPSPHEWPSNLVALVLASHVETPCHRAGRARAWSVEPYL
jgi:hypothetical protein